MGNIRFKDLHFWIKLAILGGWMTFFSNLLLAIVLIAYIVVIGI